MGGDPTRVRRVLALRAGFALLLGIAAFQACRGGGARMRAWSVQLHLHGSFSEGEGSIDSHSFEAQDVGCEVLWWSDHDFRITTYEHVTRYGFEDWIEPLDRNEPWRARLKKYQGDRKGVKLLAPTSDPAALPPTTRVEFVSRGAREGERALRLAQAGRGPLVLAFGAERRLERRAFATGLVLRLALFPEESASGGRIRVEVQLSEHAPRAGLELGPRFLRYEIGDEAGPARREGPRFVVPLACVPGVWNELELALTRDAVRGFPESPGEDNALVQLSFGLEGDGRAPLAARFDDLRFEQERQGAATFARQAELLGEVGALYPGLTELQGLEVSYDSRHLNLFCEETPLPDYAALAASVARDPEHPELLDQRAFREAVLAWVLQETHARGGLVSYNHPFGATFEDNERARSNEEQLAVLLRDRASGADLLEVGYRDRGGASLDDHLWLWDQAALAGLRLVGVGVSDSHGGPENRWRGTRNNFVSWVYAPAPDKAGLLAGLAEGRVFFGDLERFGGELDLRLDSGERMGSTLVTTRTELGVECFARGLRGGERLVVVESGVRVATHSTQAPDTVLAHRFRPRDGPSFVRFEIHDDSGPIALSNPIHCLRPAQK